jgi:hypothetical protein
MSISTIGKNGTSIATLANPVPVQLSNVWANQNYISFADQDPIVDSFQRLRVSEPRIAFAYTFANGIRAEYWDSAAYGAGTLLPAAIAVAGAPPTLNNDACQNLNTTTASATGYWIQSLYHIRYAPGISTKAQFTFNATVLQANQTWRVGCFTDQGTFPSNAGDGIFLEAVGTALFISRRYLTGGGVGAVEQVVQASWNIDLLNGTGASGINLDFTKTQHLVIEWQWLGVGTIRVGFETGSGGIVWAHQFNSVNNLAVPWSRTGSFPMRAEIFTTGVTAQAGLLKLVNCSVVQEGDIFARRVTWRYRSFIANVSGAAKAISATAAIGSWYPLIALRPSGTNDISRRASVIPTKANIMVAAAGTGPTAFTWALIYAPSTFTGATFAALTTEGAQVDTASTTATAIAGGIIVAQGIIPTTVNINNAIDFEYFEDNLIKMANTAAGTAATTGGSIMVLCVGVLGAAATVAPTFWAALNWKEDV